MQKSYTFNYVKIYLWQGIAIILNLLSMFIVIPRLAHNPAIYGIYVVCISANIFLTYTDMGFASAGQKYASEYFAQKNLEAEIKIVGFIGFIFFFMVAIFALVIIAIAFDPRILISNLQNAEEADIASKLLFILAIFSPVIIFQRILGIIYGIRLEQYIFQRIMIVGSLLKILSVFYFFRNAHYDIVGYFLFCQLAYLLSLLCCLMIANIRYNYKFTYLLKAFRYSKNEFTKTKSLAFCSLFSTFMFILYYEIDPFAIAKLLGPEQVAIYAVGLTIFSFLRNLLGVLYSPFLVRFNHYIGLHDLNGLRDIYRNVLLLTLPFVIFPIVSLVMLMKPMVLSWVGNYYDKSVIIAQMLVLCFTYAFISYPASFLIIAQEKIKIIYLTSALPPIVYWSGILISLPHIGLNAFPMSKFIAISATAIIYYIITIEFLNLTVREFIHKVVVPVSIPLIILIISLSYLAQIMPVEKNGLNLMLIIGMGGLSSSVALFIYYIFSSPFRNYTNDLVRKFFA